MKTDRVTIRVPAELRERWEAAAAASKLSLSDWLRRAATDECELHEALQREKEDWERQQERFRTLVFRPADSAANGRQRAPQRARKGARMPEPSHLSWECATLSLAFPRLRDRGNEDRPPMGDGEPTNMNQEPLIEAQRRSGVVVMLQSSDRTYSNARDVPYAEEYRGHTAIQETPLERLERAAEDEAAREENESV